MGESQEELSKQLLEALRKNNYGMVQRLVEVDKASIEPLHVAVSALMTEKEAAAPGSAFMIKQAKPINDYLIGKATEDVKTLAGTDEIKKAAEAILSESQAIDRKSPIQEIIGNKGSRIILPNGYSR